MAQGLVTLFARITKLGWFESKDDEYVFRKVIADVTRFLQVSLRHEIQYSTTNTNAF